MQLSLGFGRGLLWLSGEKLGGNMTYSIVAHDPLTGELGIAVQSHWFNVGAAVIWAEAGVGAVAVQSDADPWYGAGLDRLWGGMSAAAALADLLATGPRPEAQQLAIADPAGGIAAHTGAACLAEAGHTVGPGVSVQANMMLKATVWPAMAAAFERARGPLAERMLAALEAAEACGGDLRGRQSAALVVVGPRATGNRRLDRPVDLRVEDHPEPLDELGRLLRFRRAVTQADQGFDLLAAGDPGGAAAAFAAAVETAPALVELKAWLAWALLKARREDAALSHLSSVLAADGRWAVLLERLAAAEGVALPARVAARISHAARPVG